MEFDCKKAGTILSYGNMRHYFSILGPIVGGYSRLGTPWKAVILILGYDLNLRYICDECKKEEGK
ncbi:MAG: hypothetical protein P4L59_09555 [Desulfosporosinus sp.]|nr:hypothetical protein [Desulfosporosinus sp.]